jgi:hypothetical protein
MSSSGVGDFVTPSRGCPRTRGKVPHRPRDPLAVQAFSHACQTPYQTPLTCKMRVAQARSLVDSRREGCIGARADGTQPETWDARLGSG